MKAKIVDIGNYAVQWTALYLEEKVNWNTVNIHTETWPLSMAIYDSVWRYISERLENDPDSIIRSIETFRAMFVDYQDTKTKSLSISLWNFIVDTIFKSIVRSTDLWVELFKVNIEWNKPVVKKSDDWMDAYLKMLEAPEPVKQEPVPVIEWLNLKAPPVVQEAPKKKSLLDEEELQNLNNEMKKIIPQREQPKPKKVTTSFAWWDAWIIDMEIDVISDVPKQQFHAIVKPRTIEKSVSTFKNITPL